MKISLKTLGYEYDLTKYVDRPVAQSRAVGDVFDSAMIVIPYIKANELTGIDLSYRVPRLSIVEITDIEDTRQYYVVKSEVERLNETEFKHILELKSPEILLTLRPISDYSVTQPVDEGSIFLNEIHSQDKYTYHIADIVTDTIVVYSLSDLSSDLTAIENGYLKKEGKYKINFNISLSKITQLIPDTYTLFDNVFKIRVGDSVIKEIDVGNYHRFSGIKNVNLMAEYIKGDNTDELVVIEWHFRVLDNPVIVSTVDTSLEIIYQEEIIAEPIYMSYLVEKLLRLTSVNVSEFNLDESTRSRLSSVKAFETMDTDLTLGDALNKVANYVKAKVRLRLENGKKIIYFEYYDDLAKADYIEIESDQENIVSELNEYTSAFELKNNNIVKETILTEIRTLRTVGTSQITTENILIELNRPIDKIIKVQVAGKEFKDTDNNIVNPQTAVNITDRIVLKDYYDTLTDLESYSDRSVDTKNNHLWFERGGRTLNGMSYCGIQFERFIPEKSNRALYEAMATQLERDLGVSIKKFNDGGLDDDFVIAIKVEYMPMSESNAVIHKDDQLGFEDKIIRKINANDRVNNIDLLGSYVRQKVNAVGGTRIAKSVNVSDPELIPKIASKNADYRVVSVSKLSYDDDVTFIATLVKDYIYESEYVGIDSDRRLYRIPKDEFVDRVDKALNVLYLSKEKTEGNQTPFNLEGLVSILTLNAGSFTPPKLAYLSYDDKDISSYIDINAIGNVVEFRTEMQDNYSAGFQKLKTVLNVDDENKTFIYQRGVPYVDVLGNAEVLLIGFYANQISQTTGHLNQFPSGQTMGSGLLGEFNYPIKKDARERSILSTQISFLTNDEDIIIYDGIAKYNRQVINELRDIKMARLHYEPNRYDKFIEIGMIDVLENNAILKSGYIEFEADYLGDYAWFDNESKELLLVVKNADVGFNRLYYEGKPYEIGESTYKKVVLGFISNKINIVGSINLRYANRFSLNGKIDLKTTVSSKLIKTADVVSDIKLTGGGSFKYANKISLKGNILITSDLGSQDIYVKNVSCKINPTASVEIGYSNKLNLNGNIGLSATLEASAIHNNDIVNQVAVTGNMAMNYANKLSLIGNIKLNSEVSADLIETDLIEPVVTLVEDGFCNEVTLNIENENDVKVKVYGDNIYLFDLEANNDRDYTFFHFLNGIMGKGGTFYKTIKFVENEKHSSYDFSEIISGLCDFR